MDHHPHVADPQLVGDRGAVVFQSHRLRQWLILQPNAGVGGRLIAHLLAVDTNVPSDDGSESGNLTSFFGPLPAVLRPTFSGNKPAMVDQSRR